MFFFFFPFFFLVNRLFQLFPLEDGDVKEIPGVGNTLLFAFMRAFYFFLFLFPDPALLVQEEEAFESYDDEDEAIDMYTDTVWNEYDKKGEKVISKSTALKFFKDALTIFAVRKGKQPKDVLGPNMKEKQAYENAFVYLSADGKTLTYDKFKEFVNMADLNDVMKLLTGQKI